MAKKKPKNLRGWSVPLKATVQGHIYVEAHDEEEATIKADKLYSRRPTRLIMTPDLSDLRAQLAALDRDADAFAAEPGNNSEARWPYLCGRLRCLVLSLERQVRDDAEEIRLLKKRLDVAHKCHSDTEALRVEAVKGWGEARADVAALADALRCLHDEQNGPPLLKERHRKGWEEAMRKTQTVLRRVEPPVDKPRCPDCAKPLTWYPADDGSQGVPDIPASWHCDHCGVDVPEPVVVEGEK